MITRHHVALALLCSIIPAGILVSFDPVTAVLGIMGTAIGAILPDIHMHRSKSSRLRRIPWTIVQVGRVLCIPLMQAGYRKFFGIETDSRDKRMTHSMPGILIYSLVFTIISGGFVLLFPYQIPLIAAIGFTGGIVLGMVLHLAEDMCTKKGIYPAYPFSERRVAGSIRPCDTDDPRIAEFHFLHAVFAGVFLVIIFTMNVPPPDTWTGGVIAIGLCVGSMIATSDVQVRAKNPSRAYNPDKAVA